MRNLKFSKYPDIHAMKKDVDEYINNSELGIMSTMPDDYFDNIEFRTEGTNKLKYGYKNGFPYYISSETDIKAMQKAKLQGRYQSMYPKTGATIGDVAAATPEVVANVPKGVAIGIDNVFKLIDSVTGGAVTEVDNFLSENFPNTLGKKIKYKTPEGVAETTGTIIGQYVIPGAGVYKMARGAILLAEPLTVGLFSSKDEGNLANVIEDMFPNFTKSSELSKTLIEGLSVDADDTEIMARAKNIVADAAPFVVVEKFYKILKGLKQNPKALEELKSVGAAASPTTKPSEPVIMQGDTNLVKTNIPEEDLALSSYDRISFDESLERPFKVFLKGQESHQRSFTTQQEAEDFINEDIIKNKKIEEQNNLIRSKSDKPFYSNVEKAISNMTMTSGRGDQILATIKNTSGVKQSEIEDLGLDQFLAGKEKVTIEELNDFIADKSLTTRVKDIILSGSEQTKQIDFYLSEDAPEILKKANSKEEAYEIFMNDLEDPKLLNEFEQFKKQEQNSGNIQTNITHFDDFMGKKFNMMDVKETGKSTKFDSLITRGGENYKEMLITVPGTPQVFTDHHYRGDVPKGENLIAHTRFNDRVIDGKKTLFVEEIQSDLHQAGKKQGYKKEITEEQRQQFLNESDKILEQIREIQDKLFVVKDEPMYGTSYVVDSDGKLVKTFSNKDTNKYSDVRSEAAIYADKLNEERGYTKQLNELSNKRFELRNQLSPILGIPDAPFKNNWYDLTIKRLIKYAIDNGYDAIAFTSGDMQKTRYPGMSNPEGLKGFYDNTITKTTDKFAKKYGASLEKTNFDDVDPFRYLDEDITQINKTYDAIGKSGEIFASYKIVENFDNPPNKRLELIQIKDGKKTVISSDFDVFTLKKEMAEELDGFRVPQILENRKGNQIPILIFTPEMKKEILQEGVPIAQLEDREQEQQTAVV